MKESRFWILWNPDSHLPPTHRFRSKSEALVGARVMAARFGGTFYVVKAVSVARARPATGFKREGAYKVEVEKVGGK